MKLVAMTLAIFGTAVALAACAPPPPPPVVYVPPPPPPMAAPAPSVRAWSHGWRPCPPGYRLGPGGKRCWLKRP